ncbi:MAG TPA: hypothetical protein PK833_15310 [Vicingus sp.]|nr:hypothetical protein [Vicingus sp.]
MKCIKIFIILILFLASASQLYSQCAMCKAVVENDVAMAEGVNNGILYLMAIPYLLLIFIGYLVYNHYKKNKSNA